MSTSINAPITLTPITITAPITLGFVGATGPQGIPGDPGPAGATGPAGSDASVTNANVNTAIASNVAATRAALELLENIVFGAAGVSGGFAESSPGVFTATSATVGGGITLTTPALVEGGLYLLRYTVTAYSAGILQPYFSAGGARIMNAFSSGTYTGTHGAIGVFSGTIAAAIFLRVGSNFTGTVENISLVRIF